MRTELNQSFAKEVIDFLKANSSKTYAFYPSSGRDENGNKWKNCPYDFIILCDKEVGKDTIIGKIISIRADNNYALRLIYDAGIKKQLDEFLESQWKDNVKARIIDASLSNQKRKTGQRPFRSQVELKKLIAKGTR